MGGSTDVTERLLDAAVEVFAEHGFEAARVAEIARRADLTTGAIYARWKGKRDLIVEAVRHIVAQCVHTSSAVAAMPGKEVLAVLGDDLSTAQDVLHPGGGARGDGKRPARRQLPRRGLPMR